MPTKTDNVLVQIRAEIERRVNDQLERQRRVSPNIDAKLVVDIQIRQELEKLEKMLESEEDAKHSEMIEMLIAYLPEIGRKIKGG